MLTPKEAIRGILGAVAPLEDTEVVRLRAARGRVLAENVCSDVDLPPFEKSAMDGFAVRSAELPEGREYELRRVGESAAGAPFEGEVPPGACVEIYTGAELPAACDAVVMVEHVRHEGERVTLSGPVPAAQHVSRRGEVLAIGREVFACGRPISSVDLSVLAAVGRDPVRCFRRPRVSVLTTGDELVPASELPGRGQIREGNTLYLAAAAERLPLEVVEVGIVPDDAAALEAAFGRALEECDALVTTGGVSMGRYDLVGPVLEKLGVEPVLHKVAIKPGKPIWFGRRGAVPVLGLPGNPVSSLLGWEVFARPALWKLAGATGSVLEERLRPGRWVGGEIAPQWRQQNLPAVARPGADGVTELEQLAWKGSADIVALAEADALAVVDADAALRNGDACLYRPLDGPLDQ